MSNLKPCLGTCSWEPCWQPIARNLPREFCLLEPEPVLGNLFFEPLLGKPVLCEDCLQTCPWEPCLGTCPWKPCLGTCSQGPCLVTLLPCKETCSWNPCLGTWGAVRETPCLWTCSCEPCLETCSQEPCLETLPCLRTYSWKPFLQPFLGNLFLGTLIGNLFLGTLLGNCFWNPSLEPCLGTCSWEPGLGIVPGNLACEPVPGKYAWKSCSLGGWRPQAYAVGEKRSQASSQEEASKQVSRKRFPSNVKFLGTACEYGSQKTVPKQGPRNCFQARFQAGTRLAGTGSQASVPRKSWFQSKISRSNWELLLANLFLGTLLENPLPSNLAWEAVPGNLAWEPFPGNIAWELFPGP